MKTTLFAINETTDIWNKLLTLSLPPKLSYRIMKYYKRVILPELELINEQRQKVFQEVAREGETRLEPNTEAYKEFVSKFFEGFLMTEVEIDPVDMTMEEFVEALPEDSGSIASVDLFRLEPFFRE